MASHRMPDSDRPRRAVPAWVTAPPFSPEQEAARGPGAPAVVAQAAAVPAASAVAVASGAAVASAAGVPLAPVAVREARHASGAPALDPDAVAPDFPPVEEHLPPAPTSPTVHTVPFDHASAGDPTPVPAPAPVPDAAVAGLATAEPSPAVPPAAAVQPAPDPVPAQPVPAHALTGRPVVAPAAGQIVPGGLVPGAVPGPVSTSPAVPATGGGLPSGTVGAPAVPAVPVTPAAGQPRFSVPGLEHVVVAGEDPSASTQGPIGYRTPRRFAHQAAAAATPLPFHRLEQPSPAAVAPGTAAPAWATNPPTPPGAPADEANTSEPSLVAATPVDPTAVAAPVSPIDAPVSPIDAGDAVAEAGAAVVPEAEPAPSARAARAEQAARARADKAERTARSRAEKADRAARARAERTERRSRVRTDTTAPTTRPGAVTAAVAAVAPRSPVDAPDTVGGAGLPAERAERPVIGATSGAVLGALTGLATVAAAGWWFLAPATVHAVALVLGLLAIVLSVATLRHREAVSWQRSAALLGAVLGVVGVLVLLFAIGSALAPGALPDLTGTGIVPTVAP